MAIDLSSTCTGWALFDIEAKKLIDCGMIKPSHKGISTLEYPRAPLAKMKRMATEVAVLVKSHAKDLKRIGIEEVNLGKNRIGQKTLDACHFFFLEYLDSLIEIVEYRDSDGLTGWRTQLGHVLSEKDKVHNKSARAFNKKVAKGGELVIYTRKHVTQRWANEKFKKNLDIEKNSGDADIADALGLGWAILEKYGKH